MEVPSRRCTSEVPSIVEVQSLKKMHTSQCTVCGCAVPVALWRVARRRGKPEAVAMCGQVVVRCLARDVAIEASHNHDV